MQCVRCWLLAATLVLLSVAGVDMEYLQADNLNLLPPDEHNLVLNGGMRGIYLCRLLLSVIFAA